MPKPFGSVTALPSGRFRARYTSPVTGDRVTAPATFATEVQARKWLAVQQGKVLEGTWTASKPGAGLVLDPYATRWLAEHTGLKPRTRDLYASLLRLHVLPWLGDYTLAELTPAIVRTWQAELTTGPTAKAQSYRLLRGILNQAVRDGDLTSNPCNLPGAGTVKAPERVPPTIAQIEATVTKLPARHRALVLVAAYGGLRFGELAALTREDVTMPEPARGTRVAGATDQPAAVGHLEQDAAPVVVRVTKALHRLDGAWLEGDPKTDAGTRSVALPASLTPVLREHLGAFVGGSADALVFCTANGLPLARQNVGTMLHLAQRKANAPETHFHDLRHAGATLALQSGATTKDVMARIGHASPRAAMIYQHTSADRDALIAAALDAARADRTPALRAVS